MPGYGPGSSWTLRAAASPLGSRDRAPKQIWPQRRPFGGSSKEVPRPVSDRSAAAASGLKLSCAPIIGPCAERPGQLSSRSQRILPRSVSHSASLDHRPCTLSPARPWRRIAAHALFDSSAEVGSRPCGVSLSTTPGRTWESCFVSSSSERPDRCAKVLMILGPSAEPS